MLAKMCRRESFCFWRQGSSSFYKSSHSFQQGLGWRTWQCIRSNETGLSCARPRSESQGKGWDPTVSHRCCSSEAVGDLRSLTCYCKGGGVTGRSSPGADCWYLKVPCLINASEYCNGAEGIQGLSPKSGWFSGWAGSLRVLRLLKTKGGFWRCQAPSSCESSASSSEEEPTSDQIHRMPIMPWLDWSCFHSAH